MSGTGSWEVPSAVLNGRELNFLNIYALISCIGFDWSSLPHGSLVVDVGGGIGSTSMLLASAFSSTTRDEGGLGLKFVIQDRPVVVEMGEKVLHSRIRYDPFVDGRIGLESEMPRTTGISSHLPRQVINCMRPPSLSQY